LPSYFAKKLIVGQGGYLGQNVNPQSLSIFVLYKTALISAMPRSRQINDN